MKQLIEQIIEKYAAGWRLEDILSAAKNAYLAAYASLGMGGILTLAVCLSRIVKTLKNIVWLLVGLAILCYLASYLSFNIGDVLSLIQS